MSLDWNGRPDVASLDDLIHLPLVSDGQEKELSSVGTGRTEESSARARAAEGLGQCRHSTQQPCERTALRTAISSRVELARPASP